MRVGAASLWELVVLGLIRGLKWREVSGKIAVSNLILLRMPTYTLPFFIYKMYGYHTQVPLLILTKRFGRNIFLFCAYTSLDI